MIALIAAAWADPVILRQPPGTLAASAGPADIAVGGWVGRTGVALDLHSGVTLGLSIGTTQDLSRSDKGFGARVTIAGGLALPTLDPGLVVQVVPGILAGWQKPRGHFEVGLVAPAAVRAGPGADARLPLLAEAQGSHWFGMVRVGAHAGVGNAYSYLSPAEIAWSAGVDVAVALPVPWADTSPVSTPEAQPAAR